MFEKLEADVEFDAGTFVVMVERVVVVGVETGRRTELQFKLRDGHTVAI